VTTLIAVLVLFWLGTGPVRGFAVTLTIGIIASMFTAVTVTRLMVYTWLRWARPRTIPL
jgi:preprotein translocase subunit SecD